MMIFLILIISTFIGYLIGKSKGQPFSGALVSFLFGPLGWLIALFSSDQRPKCHACKGAVHEGATKCVNCGSDLLEALKAEEAKLEQRQKSIDAGIPPAKDGEFYVKALLFTAAAVLCIALFIGSMQ